MLLMEKNVRDTPGGQSPCHASRVMSSMVNKVETWMGGDRVGRGDELVGYPEEWSVQCKSQSNRKKNQQQSKKKNKHPPL